MGKYILIICSLVMQVSVLIAQNERTTNENLQTYRPTFEYKEPEKVVFTGKEKTEITPTQNINSLIDAKLDTIDAKNKTIKFASGYRIQVYNGSSQEEVKKIREKLYAIYPNIDIYQTYKQPDFKVKVGDYTDRLEAHYVLHQIKTHFSNAMITLETVNIK